MFRGRENMAGTADVFHGGVGLALTLVGYRISFDTQLGSHWSRSIIGVRRDDRMDRSQPLWGKE